MEYGEKITRRPPCEIAPGKISVFLSVPGQRGAALAYPFFFLQKSTAMKTDSLLQQLTPTTRERALLIASRLMREGLRTQEEALRAAVELARRWALRKASKLSWVEG